MTTLAVTEKLINDLSVITICLAKLCEDGLEERNILFSVLRLYATSEKSENSLLYNFFKKNGTYDTYQRRFSPMRNNICFWCIFGRWIKIFFQNFSVTHNFCSRLKGWNILRQDTKVCFYRGRHEKFKDFFSQEDGVLFCNDVCSVMEVLGHEYNPDQ